MFTRFIVFLLLLASARAAMAQGIMGDVFSGKLINPEVGVFAWYDLTDTTSGKQFYMRLAIVGEEKVKGKTGHWFEVKLVPRVGFPAVYKLLLTGPASDPKNVHRILMKEGNSEAVELDTSSLSEGSQQSASANRQVVGTDEVSTQAGALTAEHVLVDNNGVETDIWLNDEVRPMGLVKMKNAQGELVLRNYGIGDDKSGSMLDNPVPTGVIDEPVNATPSTDSVESSVEWEDTETTIPAETEMQAEPSENSPEEDITPSDTSESEITEVESTENAPADSAEAEENDENDNRRSVPRTQRRGTGGKR